MPLDITLSCSSADAGRPLQHTWSVCVGAGRANEGLRADWQRQLALAVRECGFRYLRFHGLFHDDMFVYREDADGRPIYNWQYIDQLFDAMLAIGIRPFVELGFMPRALATETDTIFWWKGHGSPPKDADKWAALVRAFVTHCIHRYGRDEVRQWYFEVWNEPNLDPFFRGTRLQYFALYRVTVQAVKSVDAALRVGGPATSNFVPDARFDSEREDPAIGAASILLDPDTLCWRPVWVEDFLAWCAEQGLPVDFVSTHPYPTDFALDGHGDLRKVSRKREAIAEDLALLREIVRNSAYPDAEKHCTEWSSSPSARDHAHDFPPAATYVVQANLEGAAADSLSYWAFSDIFEEGGAGDTIWHGGFGLLNLQGLPKPTYHVYRFMHRLGSEVIAQQPGAIVTRHADGRLTALLYHYPDEYPSSVALAETPEAAAETLHQGTPITARITLAGLPPDASFAMEALDAEHGWARGAWEYMGRPEPPTREQVACLQSLSQPSLTTLIAANGVLRVECTLAPWAVVLIDQIG